MGKKKDSKGGKPKRQAQPRSQKVQGGSNIRMPIATTYAEQRSPYFKSSPGRHGPSSIKISGQDLVSAVKLLGTTTIEGQIRLNTPVGPGAGLFANTRLALYGNLYERYLFDKLRIHWAPVTGTSTPVSVVLAYDRDPSDPSPSQDLTGLQSLMGHEGSVMGPVYMPHTLVAKLDAPSQGLFTNSVYNEDERLSYQGQIYVAWANDGAGFGSNAALGHLWVEYEVEFFQPQLSPTNVGIAVGSNGQNQTQGNNWWSSLNVLNQTANSLLKLKNLANDKTGLELVPGVYEVVQRLRNAASGNLIPLSIPVGSGNSGQDPSITDLNPTITSTSASYDQVKRSRVVATDPAGTLLWGELTSSGTADIDVSNRNLIVNKLLGGLYV